jgi:hypothetical protein
MALSKSNFRPDHSRRSDAAAVVMSIRLQSGILGPRWRTGQTEIARQSPAES